ncbi:site-specific integrase [Methylobacterium radiodurans]|uniref:Site-specific integrase n=2 Tax=Methylobacterium radiodurans TaxID=2202828 RepID=A0A2U8VNK0_9HYPH|nr:site-specific integrase [Methylobacterium radiodurans]
MHPRQIPMPRRAAQENVLKLTKAAIAGVSLAPGQSERVIWDAELRGFGYRLRGSRGFWVIRPPRAGGKSSLFTIGAADTIDLASARRAAGEKLAKAALGENPALARQEQRAQAAVTLGSTLEQYEKDARKRMRPSSLANLRTHINTHWHPLHGLPLASVTRSSVATRLREITEESGPHASVRARRMLSAVYVWAIGEGLAESNPVLGTNAPTDEVRRDRVLSLPELALIWRALPQGDFSAVVRLLILTGQRRDEVAEMRWDELDLDARLWRLPPSRTKNKRAHTVPLPACAVDILKSVPIRAGRDLVFGTGSGGFSGFSKSKAALDRQVSLEEPWRLHDLRRSAATGMAEIGVMPHVIEAALNHVSGHRAGVAGIYNRARYEAETRDALSRWGDEVERVCAGK